jgi:hypothetical protein
MFQVICNTWFLTNRIKQICCPKKDLLATAVHFGACSSDKLASRFFLFFPSVGAISPVILSTRPINLRLARDWSFSLSQWDIDSYAYVIPERLSVWKTMATTINQF